jgi:hypothetical protein
MDIIIKYLFIIFFYNKTLHKKNKNDLDLLRK